MAIDCFLLTCFLNVYVATLCKWVPIGMFTWISECYWKHNTNAVMLKHLEILEFFKVTFNTHTPVANIQICSQIVSDTVPILIYI